MTISILAAKSISSDGKKLKSILSEPTVENRMGPSMWTDEPVNLFSSTDVPVSLFTSTDSTDDRASGFSQIPSLLFLDGILPVIPNAMYR
jgi:hypothetical protein